MSLYSVIQSIKPHEWPIFSGRAPAGDLNIENEDEKREAFKKLGLLASTFSPPEYSKEVQTRGGVEYNRVDLCSELLVELRAQEAHRLQQVETPDEPEGGLLARDREHFNGWSMQEDVGAEAAAGRQTALVAMDTCADQYHSELELQKLSLGSLPPCLELFAERLTWLDVSGNQLDSLPESVGALKHLMVFMVGDNNLGEFPDTFSKLTKLRHLHASNNRLEALPSDIGSLPLRDLCLSGNRLGSVPPSIRGLTQIVNLHLSSNRLTQPPPEIFTLPPTSKVHIEGNLFSDEALVGIKNTITQRGEESCPKITFDIPTALASESEDPSTDGESESQTQVVL